MKNIIIGNGFLGNFFKEIYPEYQIVTRDNNVVNEDISRCIICAPTGNRRFVEKNAEQDLVDVWNIINFLKNNNISQTILVSTVDTLINTDSNYSKNRKILESEYAHNLIIRLPALIHRNIRKNFLYDLKHNQYLDTHNLSSAIQWYDLNFLKKDLENILTLNKNEYNLVSCPVSNLEIINRFFENIDLKTFSNMSPSNYNITNNGNYHCSKKQIFKSIKDYFLK